MPHALDAALLRRWAGAAVDALDEHREGIDRINVFPVPDGDTSTNLLITMRAAAEASIRAAARASGEPEPAAIARALAGGALMGARGNSGVILAQFLRGMADALGTNGSAVEARLAATHPEVEVAVHPGGQEDYLLLLGVE